MLLNVPRPPDHAPRKRSASECLCESSSTTLDRFGAARVPETAYADKRSKDCGAKSASERAQGRMPEVSVRRAAHGQPRTQHV
jgi:hypothetical protein